jgi:hypothetical protein
MGNRATIVNKTEWTSSSLREFVALASRVNGYGGAYGGKIRFETPKRQRSIDLTEIKGVSTILIPRYAYDERSLWRYVVLVIAGNHGDHGSASLDWPDGKEFPKLQRKEKPVVDLVKARHKKWIREYEQKEAELVKLERRKKRLTKRMTEIRKKMKYYEKRGEVMPRTAKPKKPKKRAPSIRQRVKAKARNSHKNLLPL